MPVLSKREQQDNVTLTAARTKLVLLQCEKEQINIDVLLGKYVLAEQVKQDLETFARGIHDAWLNFVARNSAVIASELGVDDHKCSVVLEKYIKQQLEELAESQ